MTANANKSGGKETLLRSQTTTTVAKSSSSTSTVAKSPAPKKTGTAAASPNTPEGSKQAPAPRPAAAVKPAVSGAAVPTAVNPAKAAKAAATPAVKPATKPAAQGTGRSNAATAAFEKLAAKPAGGATKDAAETKTSTGSALLGKSTEPAKQSSTKPATQKANDPIKQTSEANSMAQAPTAIKSAATTGTTKDQAAVPATKPTAAKPDGPATASAAKTSEAAQTAAPAESAPASAAAVAPKATVSTRAETKKNPAPAKTATTDTAKAATAAETAAPEMSAPKSAPAVASKPAGARKATLAKQAETKKSPASAKAKTTAKSMSATAKEPSSAKTPAVPQQRAATTAKQTAATTLPRALPTGPEAPEATIGTDAAFAAAVPAESIPHTLHNISEVRHFFRTNDVPIFFIGATPFNLLGLDRWVRNFTYISYYDAWDGAHPRVFTPVDKPYRVFNSGEEINNWLLLNPEVRARMGKDLSPGVRPKVAMVFFDEETQQICDELGYDLILPAAALRSRLDSKIVTTRLGNEAGVASVPNILTEGSDWKTLRAEADAAGLGDELVVQTPYGDSGKTTFFINTESDWDEHSAQIVGEDIKVMRRINNLPLAVEAVLTRSGTVVGPFLTELAGHDDLTPYPGGWCGNEMHPDVLTDRQRALATDLVKRMGGRLAKEGYRGFFEVDVLVDVDSDEVYLGELNPRISGASAITNVTAGAYADVPLFLFHLLEYMDVEFELDIDEVNKRWEALSGADTWSQMIIKETSDTVELLTATPATGQYYLDANGAMVFNRAALDWHMLQNESEAFFLRIYGPGDYRWKGADLGILVTKGRLQVDRNGAPKLNIRAQHFIDCLRAGFTGMPLGEGARPHGSEPLGVKSQW
ncbi:biotin carboxylase [Paeniglutamicibacter psychrophenolicus]|uniref:biotin carboxylase n=1 Tax=Paeniglutamicibacter psychrophenolicus TaxID=257454 RepID=UPI0027816972|nr:biotin carboxylase [Paeniglutamicibacter psychrophenolicus]MDQ0092735.1 hypothetical protein [Paeniglutamicibacter psychrophenolicus]